MNLDIMLVQQEALQNSIEAESQRYIEILQELIQVSAHGEEILQQNIAGRFERLGCDVEVIRSAPNQFASELDFSSEPAALHASDRVTVVGKYSGVGQGRSILLFAHPDSEPVANTETWAHAPFAGEIEHGRLYGWGVADDLSGVAAMIGALEAILSAGMQPLGSITLASTASKRRAQGILATLDCGYIADAAVYLHPAESGAGLKDIKAASSGLLRFQITVTGQPPPTSEPTHTPFYHLAVNPIDKAWIVYHALNELGEVRAQKVQHPAFAAIGRSTNLQIAYIHSGEASHLGRVSTTAVMAGSITFPPNEAIADVQEMVAGALERAANNDHWLRSHPPQLEWLMGTSGVEVPLDSSIYLTAHKAIQSITGLVSSAQSLHSASDIRSPNLFKGIPTVGFGPLAGDLTQSGGTDEWVDVEDYLQMIKIVASIIVNWCGVKS